MAIITTNGSFGATAAVTSTTLNAVADAATFSDPVDGTSLELKGDGKLGIKDAGVTKAKIENISAPLRVLGRTTAGAGVAEEVTINDNDDLSGASAITLATDESIKAYVDSSLGIKAHCVWDGTATGTNAPISGSGVTSVTRNAAGNWTINLSVTAPSASFTTLASSRSNGSSGGTTNNATGAYSTSTTTVGVTRESGTGAGSDGSDPLSFAAIW